jgi:hypothetical protein
MGSAPSAEEKAAAAEQQYQNQDNDDSFRRHAQTLSLTVTLRNGVFTPTAASLLVGLNPKGVYPMAAPVIPARRWCRDRRRSLAAEFSGRGALRSGVWIPPAEWLREKMQRAHWPAAAPGIHGRDAVATQYLTRATQSRSTRASRPGLEMKIMKIQINTDNHITGREALVAQAEATI